jgi:hypothetical protein
MTDVLTQLLVSIGAICVALIAGFFSYLNLVISKEQKISEFRQGWIDALRQDLSRYVSAVSFIANTNYIWHWHQEQGKALSQIEQYKLVQPAFDVAVQTYNSILLRLNPSERNKRLRALNAQFLLTLRDTRDALRADEFEEARKHADMLPEKLRPILKREWTRVKKGERIYQMTLWFAGLVLVAALVVAAGSIIRSIHAAPSRTWRSPFRPEIAEYRPAKITEDVRKFAAEQQISEEQALQVRLEQKSKVYAKA